MTRIYERPINYRDGSGRWQPIDDSLVAGGGGFVNRADGYRVELPSALDQGGVRVESGGPWLSMRLRGAGGRASVSGRTARYAGALPGVGVAYTAGSSLVKESLTLASAAAAAGYGYALSLSPGLSARQDGADGVDVVDSGGRVRFRLVAPFAYDSAGARVDAGHGISLELTDGGRGMRVSVDPRWLHAAERRFPVVIDPGVDVSDAQDCYIESGGSASTKLCGGTSLKVGYDGTNSYRALLKFNIQGAVPANSLVEGANVALYQNGQTTTNNSPVDADQLTRAWTTSATWNTYDGTNAWTTAGGDYATPPAFTCNSPANDVGGWDGWSITTLAQGWLDGTTANNGVLLKESTENVNNVLSFSSGEPTGADAPYLQVDWEPKYMGVQSWYGMVSQKLTDRSSLAVNVANGNLVVHTTDLKIAGTGLPLTVERTWNGLSPDHDAFGYGWSINSGYDMWLDIYNDAVTFLDPTYTPLRFTKNSNGSWKAPAGADATLTQNGDGTWTVKYNKSQVSYNFSSGGGQLQSETDQNGDKITVGAYNAGNEPTTLTDTQGRVTTLTYSTVGAYTNISQISDPSTPTARKLNYSYPSGFLGSFTDADGHVQSYGYSNNNLTSITDPAGDQTQITYDSSHRVTSIKRITNNSTGAGDTTSFYYNSGNVIVTDPDYTGALPPTAGTAHTKTVYTDSSGRVTSVLDGDNHKQSASWTSADNKVSTFTSALNQGSSNQLQNGYDSNNNLTSQQSPAGSTQTGTPPGAKSTFTYGTSTDPYALMSETNPQGNTTNFSYDSSNNLASVAQKGSAGSDVSFDRNYISTTTSTPPAVCTDNTTNSGPKGTIRCSKDGNGHETFYSYDSKGNLTQISPPAQSSPDAPTGTTKLGYDSLSRITSMTDGLAQTTGYHYDGEDRLTEADFADGSKATYTYDGDGNLTQLYDSKNGTANYTYDLKNRITQDADPWGAFSYAYDATDNRTTVTDATGGAGTQTYGFDGANLNCWVYNGSSSVSGCSAPPAGATTFGYDPDKNRKTTTYPNGVTMTTTWDNADRVGEIAATHSATTISDYKYSYTDSGGTDRDVREWMLDVPVNNKTTYTYDGHGRVQEAKTVSNGGSGSTVADHTYAYDSNGNMCWSAPSGISGPVCGTVPSGATSYAYGKDNQVCWYAAAITNPACGSPASGATTYSYDGNGMETGDSDPGIGGTSTYNARAQLSTFRGVSPQTFLGSGQALRSVNGGASYDYNTLGLSEVEYTSKFYFTRDATGGLVNEYDPNGHYYNYVFDGLGSIVALTDSTGTAANTYKYDALGNKTSSTENVYNIWQYASGLWSPSTGTYKFGQRYYDPNIARWTQPEPVDRQGVRFGNDYLYAGDDPINAVDATGLISSAYEYGKSCLQGAAIGGTAGAETGPFDLGAAGIGCTAGVISTGIGDFTDPAIGQASEFISTAHDVVKGALKDVGIDI